MSYLTDEDFEQYAKALDGVPPHFLASWRDGANRKYHCVHCGTHFFEKHLAEMSSSAGSAVCPFCGKPGGIEPCITLYCKYNEEEVWT